MLMELVGEEKRILALFSEVRFVDELTTPSFAGVWNRAQSKTTGTQRGFNLSFVAATALLICALVSLAWWSSRSQRSHDAVIANVPSITTGAPADVVQSVKGPEPAPTTRPHSNGRSRTLKLAARRQAALVAANRKAAREAKAIQSWQSPTATLMDSPSDELLKTLPQLTQTVDELRSFLPNRPK